VQRVRRTPFFRVKHEKIFANRRITIYRSACGGVEEPVEKRRGTHSSGVSDIGSVYHSMRMQTG
jgi:hypothetical protein